MLPRAPPSYPFQLLPYVSLLNYSRRRRTLKCLVVARGGARGLCARCLLAAAFAMAQVQAQGPRE
jgi:hypothetical protein